MDIGVIVRTVIRVLLAGGLATWLSSHGIDASGLASMTDYVTAGAVAAWGCYEVWHGRKRSQQLVQAAATLKAIQSN